jgi:peroxiredoxin
MILKDTTHAIGWKARDFALPGIDGKTYSLAEVRGPKGTLVVFLCNHCPYVKASINRIVAEANALRGIGVGTIAIMPNDTEAYHYFGRFTHAAFCCQSIFGNAGIVSAAVER